MGSEATRANELETLLMECKDVLDFYGAGGNYGYTDDYGCVWPNRVEADRGELAKAMWRKLERLNIPDRTVRGTSRVE